MQQFQVPQFITVEDKVVGPLTLKQALFLGAGIGIIILGYILLPKMFALLLAAPVALLSIALAFWKIDGVPFYIVLKNAVFYVMRPKLYVWKKEKSESTKQSAKKMAQKEEVEVKKVPRISESKLSDLAWSLDIKSHKRELE